MLNFKFINPYMFQGHPSVVLDCNYNREISQKSNLIIDHNYSYWHKVNASELHFARSFQGYPTRLYLARLNTRAKYAKYAKYSQLWPNTVFGAHIWASQIWSSEVSLKRSCKMQFRRVDLVSIGPPSQKLWPNQILVRRPHCNYNVKLEVADQKYGQRKERS